MSLLMVEALVASQVAMHRHWSARRGSVGADEPPFQIKGPLFLKKRSTILNMHVYYENMSTMKIH